MELTVVCPRCELEFDASAQINNKQNKQIEETIKTAVEEARRQFRAEEAHRLGEAKAEAAQGIHKLQHQVADLKTQQARKDKQYERQIQARAQMLVRDREATIRRAYERSIQEQELRIAELVKKVTEGQTKLREAEQTFIDGSASVHGMDAQHNLYEYLARVLPADRCKLDEVPRGAQGTDILVRVQYKDEPAGAIIIENKWTNTWSAAWAEKAWDDMRRHKADFAYLAVKSAALPKQVKDAGFGLAPSRRGRAGVRVWVINRSNLSLVAAIISDSVEKLLKLAELRAIYGGGNEKVRQLQAYLSNGYGRDLQEKARYMSIALKSLEDLTIKVNTESEKAWKALEHFWATEKRQHKSLAGLFGQNLRSALPTVPLFAEG